MPRGQFPRPMGESACPAQLARELRAEAVGSGRSRAPGRPRRRKGAGAHRWTRLGRKWASPPALAGEPKEALGNLDLPWRVIAGKEPPMRLFLCCLLTLSLAWPAFSATPASLEG